MSEVAPGFLQPYDIVNVIPDYPAKLIVQFADWSVREVDLSHLTDRDNPGVFAQLRDVDFFRQARAEHGIVTWPGELDLDAKAMYDRSH